MELENFLAAMSAERSFSENTIDAYRRDLEKLAIYCDSVGALIDDASSDILVNYFSSSNMAEYAASTVSRMVSATKQYYGYLNFEGLRSDDPSKDLPSPRKTFKLPGVLCTFEIEQLLNKIADEAAKAQSRKYAGLLRLYFMLELLYGTGMRVSELVSIKVGDIDERQSLLRVVGKGGKQRLVFLNDRCLILYQKYADILKLSTHKKQDYVFASKGSSGHVSRQVFARELKALAQRAGLRSDIVSPHAFRHAFASHLLQNGVNLRAVQAMLGHADISTTQIYTHLMDDHLRKTLLECHPMSAKE